MIYCSVITLRKNVFLNLTYCRKLNKEKWLKILFNHKSNNLSISKYIMLYPDILIPRASMDMFKNNLSSDNRTTLESNIDSQYQ